FDSVGHAQKVDLLGRAHAMLFPIRWSEPFGLVMVEAMACGTPVVTTNCGAARELVSEGVTGFRCDRSADLADACNNVADLDPSACGLLVEERFSAEAMLAGYEAVSASVAGR